MVERHALCGSVFEKIPQNDDEKKQAQVCIDILFQPKKTEHMDHSYVVNTAQK